MSRLGPSVFSLFPSSGGAVRSAISGRTGWVANGLLFFIFSLISIWLQYPGHVPTDGVTVWYEARYAVHFSPHPVAMALIFRVLDKIIPGPGLYTAVELYVLWLSVWMFVAVFRPKLIVAMVLYVFVLAFPPVLATSALLVKDVLSAHLAVLACLIVVRAPISGGIAMWRWLLAFALIALAVLLRYQFAIVAAIMFGWLWWKSRSESTASSELGLIIVGCAISFIATMAVIQVVAAATFTLEDNIIVENEVRANNVGHNDFERSIRKVYVYDIAGIISGNPNVALPVFRANRLEIQELKSTAVNLYHTDKVDSLWARGGLFAQLRDTPTSVIADQWRQAILSSPVPFFEHRLRTFGRLLGLGGVYMCFPDVTGIYRNPPDLAAYVRVQDYKPAFSTVILRSRYFPIAPIFPAMIYFALGLAMLGMFLKAGRFEGVFLSSAGLFYELTFFLLPQSCDVRYSYFMILTSCFSLFMIFTPKAAT